MFVLAANKTSAQAVLRRSANFPRGNSPTPPPPLKRGYFSGNGASVDGAI